MKNIVLQIDGMTCGGCVASVQRVLLAIAGVTGAEVDLANGRAQVAFDETMVNAADLVAAVEDAGFDAQMVA